MEFSIFFFNYVAEKNYWISHEKDNWDYAERMCKGRKGTLISILNRLENLYVKKMIEKEKDDFWIGLKRHNPNSSFTWIEKISPLDFQYWGQGEPKDNDCVLLHGSREFKWITRPCDDRARYICTLPGR